MAAPPPYKNGFIPTQYLYTFNSGWNKIDGDWVWALSPGTYMKHKALVARARATQGKTLYLNDGPSCYRNYLAQVRTRAYYESIGRPLQAAYPGTSSHGGLWEGKQTLAMDYASWEYVYNGNRTAWYADVRAVGLAPGMISPERGYPDEPWHVIDLDPWRDVPASEGSVPFPGTQSQEETMTYAFNVGGKHLMHVGPNFIKHFATNSPVGNEKRGVADLTKDIISPTDTWIPIDNANFLNQLDSFGIPRAIWNPTNGYVFDVSQGTHVAGGMWSYGRDAYQNTLTILELLKNLPSGSGGTAPTTAAIATAVREKFRTDPLK